MKIADSRFSAARLDRLFISQCNFSSLSQWWEVGKIQIWVFCQQYFTYSSTKIKKAVSSLDKNIKHLDNILLSQDDSVTRNLLQPQQQELGTLLQERVKGVMIRARFVNIKDMDAPSSFFNFVAQRKHMASLRLPHGRVTTKRGNMG